VKVTRQRYWNVSKNDPDRYKNIKAILDLLKDKTYFSLSIKGIQPAGGGALLRYIRIVNATTRCVSDANVICRHEDEQWLGPAICELSTGKGQLRRQGENVSVYGDGIRLCYTKIFRLIDGSKRYSMWRPRTSQNWYEAGHCGRSTMHDTSRIRCGPRHGTDHSLHVCNHANIAALGRKAVTVIR
jgi:hypothetical protein